MGNHMVFQVAIHYFWDNGPYEVLPHNFNAFRDMAEASTSALPVPNPLVSPPIGDGSFRVCRETLPVSCPNCYSNLSEWIYEYYTHLDIWPWRISSSISKTRRRECMPSVRLQVICTPLLKARY